MTGRPAAPAATTGVPAERVGPDPDPGVALGSEPVALVDLLDRVLAKGVVVSGEVTLTVADVDLVHVSLRALISSVRPDLFGEAATPPGVAR